MTNAFADYAEAIRLDPNEPVYYQNFATTVYLYRKDARQYYGITETQVFDKALELYRQAMKLAPDNLVVATDYAESYYGIRPLRTNDALAAWTNCLNISKDDNEREGVFIHLARVKIAAGMFDEAQAQLNAITNPAFGDLKQRLVRNLAEKKGQALSAPGQDTNKVVSPPPAVPPGALDATNVPKTPPALRTQP